MRNVKRYVNGKRGGLAAVSAFTAVYAMMIGWRLSHASAFAATWDQVDFALALERFDLLAMQPHFPGYPYFILGGMVVERWIPDPARALSIWNILMMAAAAYPLYRMGRKRFSLPMSLLLILFVQSSCYLWVIGGQPMSEGTAVAILWWYLWSLDRALDRRTLPAMIVPFFCFGLLMGVRLSYVPFGFGLLYLGYADWKISRHRTGARWALLCSTGVFFQLIWIAGLVAAEGSLIGFIDLARGFISGHFTDWGGGVAAAVLPLHERVVKLLEHVFWTGLSARSQWIAFFLGLLLFTLVASPRKKISYAWFSSREFVLFFVLPCVYFLWVLLAQNVDKPRHIAPLVGLFLFLLFIASFRKKSGWYRVKGCLVFSLIVLQSAYGFVNVEKQYSQLPATYQLAYELEKTQEDLIVYTWEETRVMDYLHVGYEHERIFTLDYFLQEIRLRKGQRIFLTDHVLEGFENQAGSLEHRVRKVKEFQSDSLFYPVYHRIVLYEWLIDP